MFEQPNGMTPKLKEINNLLQVDILPNLDYKQYQRV